jgi:hypothetical protein
MFATNRLIEAIHTYTGMSNVEEVDLTTLLKMDRQCQRTAIWMLHHYPQLHLVAGGLQIGSSWFYGERIDQRSDWWRRDYHFWAEDDYGNVYDVVTESMIEYGRGLLAQFRTPTLMDGWSAQKREKHGIMYYPAQIDIQRELVLHSFWVAFAIDLKECDAFEQALHR